MELLPTDKPESEWPVTIDWNTHQPLCSMICIVFGHLAGRRKRLLTGVELGSRKAACRERLDPLQIRRPNVSVPSDC